MKIRAYILIMTGAIVLPIAIFAAVALETLLRSERDAALSTMKEAADATALLVDNELSSAEAALRVLAQSPHLASGDMENFYRHARTADRGDGGRTILFLASGQQVINTVAPLGATLPPPPDYVRTRTRDVIESGRTVVSGLIKGAVQQIPVTTINVPVPIDGGRRYVLGSVFSPDYFSRVIDRRAMPASWKLSVVDRAGYFIARSSEPARLGHAANPLLMRAAAGRQQGMVRFDTRAGVDAYHAFTRSPMSGWIVTVSVPAAEIDGVARRAVMLVAIGMLAALLVAAGAAALFGRRLVNATHGAAASATALGHGGLPPRPRTGIAEFDHLQRCIGEAGRKLAAAEGERSALLQREQEARALAEEQVRIRDDFLAMLSDELRNPLSGIVGAVQLLRMDSPRPELKSQAQDILMRQSRHLTRIVDDLLDLARLARGKIKLDMGPVELSAVVESTVAALRMAGRVQHTLTTRLEPAWVRADRTRIEQVVTNLVTNALKYTPPGGAIEIALEAHAGKGQAVLTVLDDGVGIAPDLMPRLFDIFVQGKVSLDRSQGGLGIGLSLVRSLVTLHGGSIDAASAGTGQGSVFTLRLPLLEHALVDTPAAAAPARTAPATVLLVEDNEDARRMLAAHLEASGYSVLEADNGIDGLALAHEARPGLAILDIGLPGLDGYQLAARLRADAATRPMRLIALTGYGQASDRERALEAGFDAHLVKPVKFDELARELAGA
ncbi:MULTISPECIES: ATP-binding protein [Massilia]|uniref:hybrid sensor histidine kinase/response regulator n=1 Tax=Massilia TaxID=149698 RepID=UPI001C6276B8|nr:MULTISPECIES: ATP-binding protein [Massilia]QYF99635.1 response regulator [Massilia sp. NP310]